MGVTRGSAHFNVFLQECNLLLIINDLNVFQLCILRVMCIECVFISMCYAQ